MTPWTVDCRVSLSMEFSRQDYWRGLPFSSPGDLPNPGIEPRCPELQADSLLSEPPGKPWEGRWCSYKREERERKRGRERKKERRERERERREREKERREREKQRRERERGRERGAFDLDHVQFFLFYAAS